MSISVRPTRSFAPNASHTVTLPDGQVVHASQLAQSERLERRFVTVRPGVWCLIGNGLSNQTFVEGPDGIVAIDTGESVEEMHAALAELRQVTDRPIVAVLYTHFHYVAGTRAVFDEAGHEVPVYGHAKIAFNRSRTATEIAPAYSRGVVEQFAIVLPPDGPDGVTNVGLGRFFRDPAHAPFTFGFVPPTITFDAPQVLHVAGLEVHVTPAPSDSDDSVTFWFPELGTAVQNIVWPVLFNVFAIRGEEYRDPRVLLDGIEHLLSLDAEHLVAAHGPAMSGADEIRRRVTRYRDAIQFLWDQTVRLTNRGFSGPELAHAIRLPDSCDDDFVTSEFYGVTEHHVRQIRSGLFGFFDGDPAELFPLAPPDRAARMLAGFGGRDEVRRQARAAIDGDELRWAIELGTWLVQADGAEQDDRLLLSEALRAVAQRTSAANIRNWCLTRARGLDGSVDLGFLNRHRFGPSVVVADPVASVHTLRVLLVPERADGMEARLRWDFGSAGATGLHVRNCVAVPTAFAADDAVVDATITCEPRTWALVLSGGVTLDAALDAGDVTISGDASLARQVLSVFDVASLQS
ncbi:MAG: alkyl sulfatase dimerization domain-containing protein [Acidimicrobiales bacterium]